MYDYSTGDAVYMQDADHECSDPEPVRWQVYDEMIPIYEKTLKLCESVRLHDI